jgi:hypothetical protein
MLVILSPLVLRSSIGALVGYSNVCTGSASVLEAVSLLGIVGEAFHSHWDFTDGDVVLLGRRKVIDLSLEKGLLGI